MWHHYGNKGVLCQDIVFGKSDTNVLLSLAGMLMFMLNTYGISIQVACPLIKKE
jgi:hypothetical protein